jgi:surface antigen
VKRAAGLAYRRGRRDRDGGGLRRVAVPLALALGTSACGIAVPMDSLMQDDATIGSIAAGPAPQLSPDLNAEDWRRAKGALALALDPQGSGAVVAWDNPDTGWKGSFAPTGRPFVKAHAVCRAFRASLSGKGDASSLQGTACRFSGPDWAIKDVKPGKNPA